MNNQTILLNEKLELMPSKVVVKKSFKTHFAISIIFPNLFMASEEKRAAILDKINSLHKISTGDLYVKSLHPDTTFDCIVSKTMPINIHEKVENLLKDIKNLYLSTKVFTKGLDGKWQHEVKAF